MSQAQSGVQPLPASLGSIGIAALKGRIATRRRITTKNGPQFITIVRLPAPDEYTSPQTVELRSLGSLGDVGDDITVKVRIGGYGRTYKSTDAETGESKPIQTADNTLTVVE